MKSKKIFAVLGVAILICIVALVVVFTGTGSVAAKTSKQIDLGYKYLLEGNYKEAILAFEKAIQIDPKNIEARMVLADIYIETGEPGKAEIRLREVLEIKEDETGASIKLAKVKDMQGDEEEALNILYGIIDRVYYTDAYLMLADILIKIGNMEEAAAILEAAYTRSSDPKIKGLLDEITPMVHAANAVEYSNVMEINQPDEEDNDMDDIADSYSEEPVHDSAALEIPAEPPVQQQAINQIYSTPMPLPALAPTLMPTLIPTPSEVQDITSLSQTQINQPLGEDIDPGKYNKIILEPGKSTEFENGLDQSISVYITGNYNYEIYKADRSTKYGKDGPAWTGEDVFTLDVGSRAIITNSENKPILIYGSKEEFFPRSSNEAALTEITLEPGKSIEFANKLDRTIKVIITGNYSYEIGKKDGSIKSGNHTAGINKNSTFTLEAGSRGRITNTGNEAIQIYGSKEEFFPKKSD